MGASSLHGVAASGRRDKRKNQGGRYKNLDVHDQTGVQPGQPGGLHPKPYNMKVMSLDSYTNLRVQVKKMPGFRFVSCVAIAMTMQISSASAFIGAPMLGRTGTSRPSSFLGSLGGRGVVSKIGLGAEGREKRGERVARAAGVSTVRASVHEEWEKFVLDIQKEIIAEAEAADGKV